MKKVLINLYIEKEHKDWLKKEAKRRKVSIAQIIRELIVYRFVDRGYQGTSK